VSVSQTVVIEAPIERVFDLVDRPENLKLWIDGLEETTYLSEPDPDNPVGARFKQRIREGGRVVEYHGEVTAYEKPRHLAVRIGNEKFQVEVDYRLADLGGRTRLDYSATLARTTPVAWITSVAFGWLTRRIAVKQTSKLKRVAETGEA
jgi:uncharacterized protein YndB with AHSA1/START domain